VAISIRSLLPSASRRWARAAARRPSERERVAPPTRAACAWTVSVAGHPAVVVHLGRLTSRRDRSRLESRPLGRLSPTTSATPPRLHRSLEETTDPGLCSGIAARARSLPLVALRPVADPPGFSDDHVVPSASVTWRSVHAPADSRVLLHRRVRVPRRRCRRHRISSFLGFVSPSRLCLHHRGCPRSPEGPIPRPVCVWAAHSSRRARRTADGVCPAVGAATVAGHVPPWGSRRQRAAVANLGFAAVSRRRRLSPLRRS